MLSASASSHPRPGSQPGIISVAGSPPTTAPLAPSTQLPKRARAGRCSIPFTSFMPNYSCLTNDGEDEDAERDGDNMPEYDTDELDIDQMLRDGKKGYSNDRDFKKFKCMVEESKTPIYHSCKEEHNKLNVILSYYS
ncbi:hypothetical protein E2562_003750 [Oryza meyeriana var. granulata]|uniref:Uncharacterized protein n=1 Tax=Oryza meyeriana var. granulata TaxID=110450 RepID=A0A6G1BQ92_9ORYZ|nr:hypothetical protein E2562_003750 [Oryza meyeriana var. granulata]